MSNAAPICYDSLNKFVFARVPRTARRILDLGCGTGTLGRALKQSTEREVVGITHSEDEAASAASHLDRVIVRDLNRYDFADVGEFDCVICSHVLEHLVEPATVLARVRPHLSAEGILLVALPNVLFWKQRLEFLFGHFQYTRGGLMDSTHLRFFDWETADALIAGARFRVIERSAEGGFPQPVLRRLAPTLTRQVDRLACRTFPGLFGWQFVFVARPLAPSDEHKP